MLGLGLPSPIVSADTSNLFFENRSEISKLNPWAWLEKWCNAFLNSDNRCDAKGTSELA